MKKALTLMLFLALALISNAQNDSIVRVSKHNVIDSRKGIITKFVETKMKDLVYTPGTWTLKCAIRKYIQNDVNSYFLVIDPNGTNSLIEYTDLVEVNKAFDKLFKEVDADCTSNPDYLENKFTSVDGFRIGYYIKKGKPTWFVDLDTYSSRGYLEMKKPYDFSRGLKDIQSEIEKMKNN